MSRRDEPAAGWVVTPLSELLTGIESGKSFQCEERPPVAGEVGVVKVSAVSWGEYREQESKTCTTADRVNADYFIRPGDFLFSRANTIELVGACVVARQVTLRVMLSDKILRLQFLWDDLKPWMLHFLGSKAGRLQIETLASGNQESMRNIGQERLGQILVPLPPQAEQARIVAKLEELLSELDAGVAELKAAQAKLKQYRQSLLKAAVEGALTAEWRARNPPQETGTELLARILRERRARWEAQQLDRFKADGKTPPKNWQAKYIAPNPASTRSLPALPRGWAVASLDELIYRSNYGTSVKCQYGSQGVAVLRIPNISPGGMSFDDLKFATEELGVVESDYLAPGDILMIRTNGSVGIVGRVGVVPEEGLTEKFYFASYLFRMRPAVGGPLAKWIGRYLSSPQARRVLESMAASSAGQHNISLSATLRLPIPLPPLREQSAAIDMLNDLLVGTDCNEASITHGLRLAAAQRQNILRAAFAGQLVPQDPADEPASALLARIRAERAARAAAPEARRPRKRRETT